MELRPPLLLSHFFRQPSEYLSNGGQRRAKPTVAKLDRIRACLQACRKQSRTNAPLGAVILEFYWTDKSDHQFESICIRAFCCSLSSCGLVPTVKCSWRSGLCSTKELSSQLQCWESPCSPVPA